LLPRTDLPPDTALRTIGIELVEKRGEA